MLKVAHDGLTFRLPAKDDTFRHKLAAYVKEIPHALARLPAPPPGDTLVVVGACFGATVIGGLKAGFARAVAFEPDPRNRELLRLNVAANGLGDRVQVVAAAAGAAAGEATLAQAPVRNIGGSRVQPGGAVPVRVAAVDAELAALGVDPTDVGLVWCDAQGSEPAVFAGAAGLLTGRVPWGVELAPMLLAPAPPEAFTGPLAAAFRWAVDLRTGLHCPAADLPALYRQYQATPSPNWRLGGPATVKAWHTQLLCTAGGLRFPTGFTP